LEYNIMKTLSPSTSTLLRDVEFAAAEVAAAKLRLHRAIVAARRRPPGSRRIPFSMIADACELSIGTVRTIALTPVPNDPDDW